LCLLRIKGKISGFFVETSVLVSQFDEIHLYATFVLTLMLVTLHWGAGDKQIVLMFNKLFFHLRYE
jgi:uncharacterized membrane protein